MRQMPSSANQDTAKGSSMDSANMTMSMPSTRRTGNRSRMGMGSEEGGADAEQVFHVPPQPLVGQEEAHVVAALDHGVAARDEDLGLGAGRGLVGRHAFGNAAHDEADVRILGHAQVLDL